MAPLVGTETVGEVHPVVNRCRHCDGAIPGRLLTIPQVIGFCSAECWTDSLAIRVRLRRYVGPVR